MFKEMSTDLMTVSKYCLTIEELLSCFGENFTDNCIHNTFDGVIDSLLKYNSDFEFTLVGERLLCPNKDNGMTIETAACLWSEAIILFSSYDCEQLRTYSSDDEEMWIKNPQVMTCKLLHIEEKCGEKARKAFCDLIKSNTVSYYRGWPDISNMCDRTTNKCQCVKYAYY